MVLGYDNPTPEEPVSCGRYQLIERIGYGGMAEVFRARLGGPNGFSKTVVVKRVLPRLLDDEMVMKMFIEEAKIAAAADHDNIAKVFELGRADDGRFFMVMEYLAGVDLEMLLRAGAQRGLRVPMWFTLQVVSELLEALSFVHSLADDDGNPRNVIHRDVTPSNIFVTYLGRVKLSDFGIADFAGKTPTTVAGQLKGKLAYMSPEQLNAKLIDQRSDLFTVGVVLWEALTQQRLFGQLNEMQAMLAICDDARKPPSALQPEVPPELDAIVLRALAADRDQRYRTAADLQSDLLDCLHRMRGPVRRSEMKRVVQVLLGREEPNEETRAKPMTPARAREPNASFLLELGDRQRKKLIEEHSAALKEQKLEDSSDLEATFVRGFAAADEDATLPMRALGGVCEFWVKTPKGPAIGPIPYGRAHEHLAEAGLEGAPIAISVDQRHWMNLQKFGELSGQDLLVDPSVSASNLTIVGSLEQRSIAAVFGLISRDQPTGTLSVANTDSGEWYEIHVANGEPVGVMTNVSSMQLPAMLVSKKLMTRADVEHVLHGIVKTGRSAEEVARAEGLRALDRESFLRERLVELFRWTTAEYSFHLDPNPKPTVPFAHSMLALLPGLVDAACTADELDRRLGERVEAGLEPSWRFADAIEELGLGVADRAIVDRLRSGRPITKLVEERPALARRILVFAYVMTEADLLLAMIEPDDRSVLASERRSS